MYHLKACADNAEHCDAFLDVPRLSTLQALLIVLKARESAPKRGYYYRSWMTVVQCVTMARDLGLDEHYDDHKAGRSCGSNMGDCITKTRIWQTLFICELMIGSPQGLSYLTAKLIKVNSLITIHQVGLISPSMLTLWISRYSDPFRDKTNPSTT